MKAETKWKPPIPDISLMGCCSYEETWKPGITGWGMNDADSRANGYVSVPEYDELVSRSAAMYEALANLENDDNSIPEHAWKLVQAALAKAAR